MVRAKSERMRRFFLLMNRTFSRALVNWVFLLGKICVSHWAEKSFLPCSQSTPAMASVRAGSSQQIRERDFLLFTRSEIVA